MPQPFGDGSVTGGDKGVEGAATRDICDAPCHANPETYSSLPLDQALSLFLKNFLSL